MDQKELATHELICIKKYFFHLSPISRSEGGWNLPIYFDRTSNTFRISGLPTYRWSLELKDLPPNGPYEFEVTEPVQYASDFHTTTIKGIFIEPPL